MSDSESGESEPLDGDTINSEESISEDEQSQLSDNFIDSDSNSRDSRLVRLARSIGEGFGQVRSGSRTVRRRIEELSDDSGNESDEPLPPAPIPAPQVLNNVNPNDVPPVPAQVQGLGRVPNKKGRGWTVVINNFSAEDREKLERIYTNGLVGARSERTRCDYLIYQLERGDNTGTPHVQGYLHFSAPVTLRSILQSLQRNSGALVASVRIANGSAQQNKDYCSKDDTRIEGPDSGPHEFGEMPRERGKRRDLSILIGLVKDGAKRSKCYDTEPVAMLQYCNGINQMFKHYSKHRQHKTHVVWMWGPPGSGKTRAAHTYYDGLSEEARTQIDAAEHERYYIKSCDNKWWCGYDGQPIVILDDLRPDSAFSFPFLLLLFDRYPLMMESKGGQVSFISHYIIVTSPVNPVVFYSRLLQANKVLPEEDPMQLYRRIDEVKQFTMPEQLPDDVIRAQAWVNEIIVQQNVIN